MQEALINLDDLDAKIPKRSGLYAIFIKDKKSLPESFAGYLAQADTNLIYIGKASQSLHERLYEQDLRHKSPSTFFRSIGAILSYRPAVGSLVKKRNQNNYKFTKEDTEKIIDWIDENLYVSWQAIGQPSKFEKKLIKQLCPIINIKHNPKKLEELVAFRKKCLDIARNREK